MDEQKNPYGPESTQTPPTAPQPPQPNSQQAPNYNQQAPNYNQQAPYTNASMPRPESNLVWAILCTVLCCLPLGIVSIVYASKVDGCYASGRYAEAVRNSKEALKWAKIGALLSVVFWILYVLIYVVAFGAMLASL